MPYDFILAEHLLLIGIASGIVGALAYVPYIRNTLAGRTRPQRASWLIWSVLSAIALCSQIWEGATTSLWFSAVMVSGTFIVFLLSIRYGVGGWIDRRDMWVLALAALGVVAWVLTQDAIYALAMTISISLLGGVVTVAKAYAIPKSETLSKWVLSLVSSALALVAVGAVDPVLMAYPAYLLVLNVAIIAAMLLGRGRHIMRIAAV